MPSSISVNVSSTSFILSFSNLTYLLHCPCSCFFFTHTFIHDGSPPKSCCVTSMTEAGTVKGPSIPSLSLLERVLDFLIFYHLKSSCNSGRNRGQSSLRSCNSAEVLQKSFCPPNLDFKLLLPITHPFPAY